MEELLCERGITVTYEAIRKWCRKFGQQYANQLRRRRPRPGDKWHLDEVVLTIKGERHYLWRAVDQDGTVLDILVQRRRNKRAAKKFFRKLLKGLTYVPRVIVTDKLKSYGAAKREILPLSGVGFCEGHWREKSERAWQDRSTPAYWDIATYFSEPEERDVLPQSSVSMDRGGHYPHGALEQTARGGVSVMECGQGVRPVVRIDRGQSLLSRGAGAQAEHGAPTVARVVL